MPRRPCSVCEREFPRVKLHRVGFRAMCRPCFEQLWVEPCTEEPDREHLGHREVRSLAHLNLMLLVASALAKTGFFAAIFWWAHVSELGAAALDGLVGAEVLTWAAFTVLDRGFRSEQIRWGLLFEVALVAAYFGRGQIIDVNASAGQLGMTFMFALLFGTVKTGIWCTETILEITGVKE